MRMLAMLGARPDPGRAVPRLGRRLGRSRAARAYGGRPDRRRRVLRSTASACRPPRRWQRTASQPLELGPKEGLALLNGTQVSTAWRSPRCSRPSNVFQAALVTGALSTDAAKGSDTPFDPRIHALRGHRGPDRDRRGAAAPARGQRDPRLPSHGDDRVQDPYCLRCQPQVMGAASTSCARRRRRW